MTVLSILLHGYRTEGEVIGAIQRSVCRESCKGCFVAGIFKPGMAAETVIGNVSLIGDRASLRARYDRQHLRKRNAVVSVILCIGCEISGWRTFVQHCAVAGEKVARVAKVRGSACTFH